MTFISKRIKEMLMDMCMAMPMRKTLRANKSQTLS